MPSAAREIVRLPIVGQIREHVSFSELMLFESCQWKWYLTKIENKFADERSLPMEFGSAIHAAMEALWSPDETPDLQTIDSIFLRTFDENCIGLVLQPHEDDERIRLRELGPKIIRDSMSCEDLAGIKPLATELSLMEDISRTDDLRIKFKGFIDFIFVKQLKRKKVIYIADFKTCTWGWPAKKIMDPNVQAQVLLYKHFFCKVTGADPSDVTAAFILLKKTPRDGDLSVEVVKIGSGPKAMDRALMLMQSSITAMHSGEYVRNRNNCKRSWIDRETKEERTYVCQFLGNGCPHSASG